MRKASLLVIFALGASLVTVVSAPAGASQSFIVDCKASHRAPDDPIVFPGQPGAAHLHEFFGNTSTNARSTYSSMIGKPTTCDTRGDTAGYWAPVLFNSSGRVIPARRITVYYRDRPQSSKTTTPFPPDFRMIAGAPQNGVSGFNCEDLELSVSARIDCTGHRIPYVRASVIFPMCGKLNGAGQIVKDSADHRSHMAYGRAGPGCPSSHPIQLPAIKVNIRYSVSNCKAAGCYLSSDMAASCSIPGCSLHSDFWNTWDQNALKDLVRTRLN